MSVAPVYPQSVGTYQLEGERTNIGRHPRRVEQAVAAHLLHAGRTGACQPECVRGKEPPMALLIPFDENPIVATGDGVGDRVRFHAP